MKGQIRRKAPPDADVSVSADWIEGVKAGIKRALPPKSNVSVSADWIEGVKATARPGPPKPGRSFSIR